jgi:hypothetical protein
MRPAPAGRLPAAGLLLLAAGFSLGAPPAHAQEIVYRGALSTPSFEDALGFPQAVTSDPHTGETFVCDTRKNRILIFDRDGGFRYQIQGGEAFSAPGDLAVDPWGYLLVLAHRERRQALVELDFDGLFLREILPSGAPAGLAEPAFRSVAVSPTGDRVFLLDQENLALWVLGRDGEVIAVTELSAEASDRERRDTMLSKVDVYGETVLVAVPSAGKVRLFDLDGVETGSIGVHGTGPCQLGFPAAAALDEEGNLLVVDQQRMFLVRWEPAKNRCLGDYVGAGSFPGFLYYPMDVALDGTGRVYTSQGYQGWVQIFDGFTPAKRFEGELPSAPRRDREPGPVEQVESAIRAWASARNEGLIEVYLRSYSLDFRPSGGEAYRRWADEQRRISAGTANPMFEISGVEVEMIRPSLARARFVEIDRSDPERTARDKVILLRLEGSDWKILEEREDF